MHTCTHAHMHTCTHTHMHTCTHTHIHTGTLDSCTERPSSWPKEWKQQQQQQQQQQQHIVIACQLPHLPVGKGPGNRTPAAGATGEAGAEEGRTRHSLPLLSDRPPPIHTAEERTGRERGSVGWKKEGTEMSVADLTSSCHEWLPTTRGLARRRCLFTSTTLCSNTLGGRAITMPGTRCMQAKLCYPPLSPLARPDALAVLGDALMSMGPHGWSAVTSTDSSCDDSPAHTHAPKDDDIPSPQAMTKTPQQLSAIFDRRAEQGGCKMISPRRRRADCEDTDARSRQIGHKGAHHLVLRHRQHELPRW